MYISEQQFIRCSVPFFYISDGDIMPLPCVRHVIFSSECFISACDIQHLGEKIK